MQKDREFRFLHLADWGPITGPALQAIEPITPSLVAMIKEGKVDCAILNGDIGYEFNSNIRHHEETMAMIQEIASLVPIVLNRGNHEVNYVNNTVAIMFDDYFQLYDLELSNATGVTIGPLFLAIIDPTNMVIPRLYSQFTEKSLYSSREAVKPFLEKAEAEGKTIVALTHYPLVCGFPTQGHCIPAPSYGELLPLYVNLQDFYTLVLKHHVPLVLSAHVHVYERTRPFISGYRSKSKEDTAYTFNSSFFIQVVEGVSGCVVESASCLDDTATKGGRKTYKPPAFVASHDQEHAGFGMLHASAFELKYEHFKLAKGQPLKLSDSFTIQLPKPKQPEDPSA